MKFPRDTIDLQAIRERVAAATPGPWAAWPVKGDSTGTACDGVTAKSEFEKKPSRWGGHIIQTDSGVYGPCMADATFIAAARTDVPALLALVDDQARELAAAKGLLEAAHEIVEALTGALLAVEWRPGDDVDWLCVSCGSDRRGVHCYGCAPGTVCEVDVALTVAGFPDQASRDAERARRGGR